MYTNPATLTRYRTVEPRIVEPIRTRPDRYTEDGEPVRFRRPGRSTAEHEVIARQLGFRR